jgi:hypothetical protein
MIRRMAVVCVVLALLPCACRSPGPTGPDEPNEANTTDKVQEDYETNVSKGLTYLAKAQHKDGHWERLGGGASVPWTAAAGLALLSEGSTTTKGAYENELQRAVHFILAHSQKDGRLADPDDKAEAGRYMLSHGYAMLFLSQAYAKETDGIWRREIGNALEKAVEFAQKSRTSKGGWGFVSAADGGDLDKGDATAVVLHGLLATRRVGIAVPEELLASGLGYLEKCSTVVKKDADGKPTHVGLINRLSAGGDRPRPHLTAAAVALVLNAGETNTDQIVRWLNYLQEAVPIVKGENKLTSHVEFTYFFYAQAVYRLGEDGHARLRPDLLDARKNPNGTDQLLRWSRSCAALFANLVSAQEECGSWRPSDVREEFSAALYLIILQLDKGNLPYFKR